MSNETRPDIEKEESDELLICEFKGEDFELIAD